MAVENMKKMIEDFAMQLREALKIATNLKLSKLEKPIHNIVISGIGGSGVGANLVEAFIEMEISVPFNVVKGYKIPNYVNENTLFIVSSFSGNTEEVLDQLKKAQAKNPKIVCITNGGKLLEIAKERPYDFVKIPGERTAKRYSIGTSIILLLAVLHHYGFVSARYINAVLELTQYITRHSHDMKTNAALLAQKLHGRLPIVYSDAILYPIILRVQQMINENAKQLCHINTIPELTHNELVAWDQSDNFIIKNSIVLLIRSSFEHAQVQQSIEFCRPIFVKEAAEVVEIHAMGKTFIEQSLYLIHFFDWVSYDLAQLNNVDPYQINLINKVKDALSLPK